MSGQKKGRKPFLKSLYTVTPNPQPKNNVIKRALPLKMLGPMQWPIGAYNILSLIESRVLADVTAEKGEGTTAAEGNDKMVN